MTPGEQRRAEISNPPPPACQPADPAQLHCGPAVRHLLPDDVTYTTGLGASQRVDAVISSVTSKHKALGSGAEHVSL